MELKRISYCGAFLVLATACAKEAPPPVAPTGSAEFVEAPSEASQTAATQGPETSRILIDDRIRKACGISDTDAYFDFDSSRISPEAERVLSALARCFSTGPLKGEGMKLVGHADPRGDSEYNLVLGGQRADHVSKFLGRRGVQLAQMSTTSRGEMDARGQDERGWSQDRRVDVMLAE